MLIGVATLAIGCTGSSGGDIAATPDFAGFVTAIEPEPGGNVLGTILVESHADKRVQRMLVTVTKDTSIMSLRGSETTAASFEVLRLQDQVRVWVVGPVRPSRPKQATAKQVLVVGRY